MPFRNIKDFEVSFKVVCLVKSILDAITLSGNQQAFDNNFRGGKFNSFLSMINDSNRGFSGSGGMLIDMIFELFQLSDFFAYVEKNKINKAFFILAGLLTVFLGLIINNQLSNFINKANSPLINNVIIRGILGAICSFTVVSGIILFCSAIDATLKTIDETKTNKIKKKLGLLVSLLAVSLISLVLETYLRIYKNINNPLILFSLTAISILFGISVGCKSIICNLLGPKFKELFKDYNNCFKDQNSKEVCKENNHDIKTKLWKLAGYFFGLFSLTLLLSGISHIIELKGTQFFNQYLGNFGADIINNILYGLIFLLAVIIGTQASATLFEIAKIYSFDNQKNFDENKNLKFEKNIRLAGFAALTVTMFTIAIFPLVGIVAHFDKNINLGPIEKIFTKSFTPLIILVCITISTIILGYLTKLYVEINNIHSKLSDSQLDIVSPTANVCS